MIFFIQLNRETLTPPPLIFFADLPKLRFELDNLDFNLLRDLYRIRDHVCDVKRFLLSFFICEKYTNFKKQRQGLGAKRNKTLVKMSY